MPDTKSMFSPYDICQISVCVWARVCTNMYPSKKESDKMCNLSLQRSTSTHSDHVVHSPALANVLPYPPAADNHTEMNSPISLLFPPPTHQPFLWRVIWGIIQSMVSAVRKWLLTWWTGWRAAWRPRSSCPLLPGSARPPYPAPCPARTETFAQTRRSIIDRPSHLLSLGHTQPCVETSPLYKSVTIFYLRYKF